MVRLRKVRESNPLGNPALPVPEPKAPKKMMKKQESKAEVMNAISNVPAQSNVIAPAKRTYVKKAKAPARERSESPKPKRKYVKKAKTAEAPEIQSPPYIQITPMAGKPKRSMKPSTENMAKLMKEAEMLQNKLEEAATRAGKGEIMMKSAKSGQLHTAKATKKAVLEDIKEQMALSKERKNEIKNEIKNNSQRNKELREEVRQYNMSEKKLRTMAKEARSSYAQKRPSNVMYNKRRGIKAHERGAREYALPENEMMFL